MVLTPIDLHRSLLKINPFRVKQDSPASRQVRPVRAYFPDNDQRSILYPLHSFGMAKTSKYKGYIVTSKEGKKIEKDIPGDI